MMWMEFLTENWATLLSGLLILKLLSLGTDTKRFYLPDGSPRPEDD